LKNDKINRSNTTTNLVNDNGNKKLYPDYNPQFFEINQRFTDINNKIKNQNEYNAFKKNDNLYPKLTHTPSISFKLDSTDNQDI